MGAHLEVVHRVRVEDVARTLEPRFNLFDAITLRQDYPGSAHHATKSIFLRWPDPPGVDTWFLDIGHVDTPVLKAWPEAQVLLEEIELFTGRTLGKAMLVMLKPGGGIDWHFDQGEYAAAHYRLHVPIVPCPAAALFSGNEAFAPSPGDVVRYDTTVLHSAANFGATPRIHLIVDYRKV